MKSKFQVRPRLYRGQDIALGPGKADLLEAILAKGSIAAAAAALGMSYMRAWTLIQIMNRCFKTALVETKRGGSERGAAVLTETGGTVLALYRRIETESLRSTKSIRTALLEYLR